MGTHAFANVEGDGHFRLNNLARGTEVYDPLPKNWHDDPPTLLMSDRKYASLGYMTDKEYIIGGITHLVDAHGGWSIQLIMGEDDGSDYGEHLIGLH